MRKSLSFLGACVLICLACCSCGIGDSKSKEEQNGNGISETVIEQTIPLVLFSNSKDNSVLWYCAEWNTALGTIEVDDRPFVQCEADAYWEVIRWDGGREFVFWPRTSHREKLKDDRVSLRWLDQSEVDMCHYLDAGMNVKCIAENDHLSYEVTLPDGETVSGTIFEPSGEDTNSQAPISMSLIEIGQIKDCVNFVYLCTLESGYGLRSAILDFDQGDVAWTEMALIKDDWVPAYTSLVSGEVAFSDTGLVFGAGDTVLCYSPGDAKIDPIFTKELESILLEKNLSRDEDEEGLDFMNFKSYWDSQGNETIIGYHPRLSKGGHAFYFLYQGDKFAGAIDISDEEVEVYDRTGEISQKIDVSQLRLSAIPALFPDSGARY